MSELTEKGLHKRDEILAAADRLLRKHGYTDMTLRMLSDEAKISRGHLGHYFKEKKDVLAAMMDNLIGKLWKYSREVLVRSDDPLLIYACANYWFFLICSEIPELNRLMLDGSKIWDVQTCFTQKVGYFFISSIKEKHTMYSFTREDALKAVSAAYAAHFVLINSSSAPPDTESVLKMCSIHVELLCHLLGLKNATATRINQYAIHEITKYSVKDLVEPFNSSHDYQWYELDAHEFKI